MPSHFRRRPWYQRHPGTVLALVVLVVAAGGVAVWQVSRAGKRSPATTGGSILANAPSKPSATTAARSGGGAATGTPTTARTGAAEVSKAPARAKPATFSGSYGTEASWVVAENRKAGTDSWRIPPGTTSSTISGYADHTSAHLGNKVTLYVSTAAPSFQVSAYRMGYYGGTGARLIWQSGTLHGSVQASCPVNDSTYTVSCSWTPAVSFTLNRAWVQGDYLLKLSASTGGASYVPLTVTDPASHATYVILNSVLTWQAWNPYGGYDCFQGPTGQLGPTDPIRARVVSYDRPYEYSYSDGQGSGDFMNLEYPAVRFAEEHGLDVTYMTDIDLNDNPALLEHHRALLSMGHNEFWTAAERQALVTGKADGVNLVFFGATPGLRPARMQPSPLGPDREMAAYRNATEDPVTSTNPTLSTPNEWGDPPLDKPSNWIVGNSYGGYGINATMVIVDPTAWPFANTGAQQGTGLAHLILGDYDHYVPDRNGPQDVQILAHSPVTTSYGSNGNADMIYYTDPTSHAGVFSTGTIGWVGFLNSCGPGVPCGTVQTITGNVLRLFGTGPAGKTEPSQSNSSSY